MLLHLRFNNFYLEFLIRKQTRTQIIYLDKEFQANILFRNKIIFESNLDHKVSSFAIKLDSILFLTITFNSFNLKCLELWHDLFQYGEVDCWQMECPPVTCSNPVTEDGDCCPRCEDDPCARETLGNDTSLSVLTRPQPCSYSGIIHESGSSWQDPHDKCTTCECKVRRMSGCGNVGGPHNRSPHKIRIK